MLPVAHGGEVAGVHKLQAAVHGAEAGQHHKLSRGGPEQMVGRLPLVLLQHHRGLTSLTTTALDDGILNPLHTLLGLNVHLLLSNKIKGDQLYYYTVGTLPMAELQLP